MNDLVIVMSGKELQVDKNGIVTRLRMTLELRAAGAAKTLGAGVRFTKLSQAMKPDKFRTNGKTYHSRISKASPLISSSVMHAPNCGAASIPVLKSVSIPLRTVRSKRYQGI